MLRKTSVFESRATMVDAARPATKSDVNIWAATVANDYATVERLLRDGVAANERNSLGETALHLAASRGYDDLLSLLLRHGGSPHLHDKESGYTPLHRSLLHDHINTSLLLLNAGAHLTVEESSAVVDHDGLAPMDLLSTKLSATYPHQLASARGGEIYTFGKVDFQLGYHLPHGDEQVMPRRVKLPPQTDIVQVAAARYHTLVVSSSGDCFSWGFGKGGRLGTGTEFNCIHPVPVHFPQRAVLKVAAGENHSLALTTGGQLFSWGSNSFGQLGFPLKLTSAASRLSPKRIDAFKGVVVVDIAASSVHSVALTESGHVFTWGSNKKGQLGRKDGFGTDQGFSSPKRVDALLPNHAHSAVLGDVTHVAAVKVAVSCNHTCVVLNVEKETSAIVQGQVWQWGYNAYFPSQVLLRHVAKESRLRQHHHNLWVPRCQQHAISIADISCAAQHSIGLSTAGNVYTWGHGPGVQTPSINYVQLAHRAVSVCAAKEHCAVVLATGDVYTWGCGSLGHEGRNWQPVPKRVPRLKRASAVAAGPQHTVVLVAPDRPQLVPPANEELPTLASLCEQSLAAQLSLETVVKTYNHADAIYATALVSVCNEFARRNFDAVLDMAKDLEEFPIYLDEETAPRASAADALTPRAPSKSMRMPGATMAPHEVEKRLRTLGKRLRQIDDLEKLATWTDAQAEKLARKPFILDEIDILERHLEKVRATPPPPPPVASPEITVADASEIPDVVDTRPVAYAPSPEVVIVDPVPTLKGKRESPREKASKAHHPTEMAARKPTKEARKTEPKAKKTKTKFVPLDTFLLSTPAPPPMPKAVVAPVWNSPPQHRPINAPSTPAAKSGPTFALEAFVKTKGPKKPAPKQQSPMWGAVPAPVAVPSLTAIQSSQVVEVTQTWNLKENSWGLCQEENVKLEDVQTLALIEKLLAEDAAALAAMQQQHQPRPKTTSTHRSKTKANAFRTSKKASTSTQAA
ncbi:hypothetical protein SDRG_06370 [Saprolegnia diclina VS20]|uniref:RCC1-like domain-containing protein n=1 Tax=Saprolegnia diclina (strain VS20) TaxID=1156394 RepID=T0QQS6_SAPDV|nr:hypothetical protein SDRG_06370 [Saprolegnia diclina VS20]EQC36265.1 hypothetical protein SDRG_06370 [Saprolegnia diclina VS20]|eukprot:XP_008610371.1 hypothetical protein SDRG_06370 [Saprolegnia diclina VS20]